MGQLDNLQRKQWLVYSFRTQVDMLKKVYFATLVVLLTKIGDERPAAILLIIVLCIPKQFCNLLCEADHNTASQSLWDLALDLKFILSVDCKDASFVGLRDIHRGLCQKADANREEVESLQNLITRLDFNGFFASAQQHVNVTAMSYQLPVQPVR